MGANLGKLGHDVMGAGSRLVNPGSIKGKIFTIFSVAFLSIAALTALNLWNFATLKERLLLSERYDDLLNNILEVRRFEKNFLIYGDPRSMEESIDYLDRIDTLVTDLSTDLTLLTSKQSFEQFQENLKQYRAMAAGLSVNAKISPATMRTIGKTLTNDADQFRESKRKRIHAAIVSISILPFAFFAILFSLLLLVVWLISHGLLKPLALIVQTTRSVGRGDFSPLDYHGVPLEEISGLIQAFNHMAKELEMHQEDLIQTRKIAAIGTFTAGIAHELNNPINNIVLTAESLKEELAEETKPENMEMLGDILTQAERAADIVKNLLDFSRTERPIFSQLAPELILSSSINLLKNQIKIVGLHFETLVADNLPPICGNLGNLQQVFTNLLLNAIQASPQGATIRLTVDFAEQPSFIAFLVQDSGGGIPQEIQHKIFEPFFSTKEVGKGTGLGLAVSYSIVKRHGGKIKVHSELGQGATFTVLLPHVTQPTDNDFPYELV
ncbi:MAG: ATP-binding protein [Desulfobulbus sp.]|nr:ATP-binding protein [Desulfobulbus sp.]